MSFVLGAGGWLLAVMAIGAAVAARIRLYQHVDAVARASHEVRGPLTAVGLGLELAARVRQLPVARLRALELELGRAAVALDDLVVGPERRAVVRDERVDVGRLLASSVEAWRPVAAARGAAITLERPLRSPFVTGERLRLAQAVGNLLANAIEHGGGVVEVSCRATLAQVIIEIRDDGAGLPAPLPELGRPRAPRLPWPARYGNASRRGHGLAVVGAVAAAHRGRLASAPCDHGVRMLLELPEAGYAGPGTPGRTSKI